MASLEQLHNSSFEDKISYIFIRIGEIDANTFVYIGDGMHLHPMFEYLNLPISTMKTSGVCVVSKHFPFSNIVMKVDDLLTSIFEYDKTIRDCIDKYNEGRLIKKSGGKFSDFIIFDEKMSKNIIEEFKCVENFN